MIAITKHSRNRMIERLKINNEQERFRVSKLAFKYGFNIPDDFKKSKTYKQDCIYQTVIFRYFRGFIWIFKDNCNGDYVLTTLYAFDKD